MARKTNYSVVVTRLLMQVCDLNFLDSICSFMKLKGVV